jgi:hypothetical protein
MDLNSLLNGGLIFKIVVGILGILGIAKYFKNRAIQKWANLAFKIVEEADRINIAEGDKSKILDKISMFSEKFTELMKNAGWLVLTNSDIEQAQNIAKAINVIYENGKALVSTTNGISPK